MLRDSKSGDWIGTFAGHKGPVWCCQLDSTGILAATVSGDFTVVRRCGMVSFHKPNTNEVDGPTARSQADLSGDPLPRGTFPAD